MIDFICFNIVRRGQIYAGWEKIMSQAGKIRILPDFRNMHDSYPSNDAIHILVVGR
jgi:hypothetical protein